MLSNKRKPELDKKTLLAVNNSYNILFGCCSFVFLALMEYCLVNIVLGDNDGPKMPEIPNQAANIRNMSVKVKFLYCYSY